MRGVTAVLIFFLAANVAGATDDGWAHKYFTNTTLAGPPCGVVSTAEGITLCVDNGGPVLMRVDAAGMPLAAFLVHDVPGRVRWMLPTAGAIVLGANEDEQGGRPFVASLAASDRTLKWTRQLTFDRPSYMFSGTLAGKDGIAVAGRTGGDDDGVAFVVRFAPDGLILWARRYFVAGANVLASIRGTRDGGLIAGGSVRGSQWLLRLDSAGNVVWNRRLGLGSIHATAETRDGGFVATGEHQARIWIARFDRDGRVVWQRTAPGDAVDAGLAIQETPSGNLLLAAYSESYSRGAIVAKLNASGKILWQRIHGAAEGDLVTRADLEILAAAGESAILLSSKPWLRLLRFGDEGRTGSGCALVRPATVTFADVSEPGEPISVEAKTLEFTLDHPRVLTTKLADVQREEECNPAKDTVVAVRQPAPQSARSAAYEAILARERATKKRLQELLRAKKFDELEELGTSMRLKRAERPPRMQIEQFWEAISADDFPDSADQTKHLAMVEEWRLAKPKSPFAQIAFAEALMSEAWRVRGSGFSSTVTPAAAAEYGRLMQRAADVLRDAEQIASSDPEYYTAKAMVAGSLGGRHDEILEAAKKACSIAPYPKVFRRMTQYFSTRWGGEPAQFNEFARIGSDCTKSMFGDALYASMAEIILLFDEDRAVNDYKISWPHMRAGFEEIIAANPDYLSNYFRFASAARFFDDRETLKKLFAMPELAWSSAADDVMGRPEYDEARAFAFPPKLVLAPVAASNGEPWMSKPAAAWPQLVVRTEMTLINGEKESSFPAFAVDLGKSQPIISALSLFDPWAPPVRRDAPTAFAAMRTGMKSWSVGGIEVDRILPRSDDGEFYAIGAVLVPKSAPRDLTALKIRMLPALVRSTVYIVTCVGRSGSCEQRAYAAVIDQIAGGASDAGGVQAIRVALPKKPDDQILGAPVIDEGGHVVAAVIRRASTTQALFWCEPVLRTLAGSGLVTTEPASLLQPPQSSVKQ